MTERYNKFLNDTDKVNVSQITGVHVRFIPKPPKKSCSKSMNRTLASDNIFFGGKHTYETNGHVSPRLHHYGPTGSYSEKPLIG